MTEAMPEGLLREDAPVVERQNRPLIGEQGSRDAVARRPLDRYFFHPDAGRGGHRVDVLVDGDETCAAMLDAIGAAKTEIILETYVWTDDATGRKFVEALETRARAGLPTRSLMDLVRSGFPRRLYST